MDAASALKLNTLFNFEACHGLVGFETLSSSGMEGTIMSQVSCSKDFRRQLEGYGLTTANILYRRPDHPWLLQSYVWQDYDLFPRFPTLNKFLNFWLEKLEGPLHSVTVAHARLIKPAEIRAIDGEFRLH
jgi:uncharacterized protein Usg